MDDYGAKVERGEIIGASGSTFTVKSLDRDGITVPSIPVMQGTYSIGDRVYFFVFDDGSGSILSAIDEA